MLKRQTVVGGWAMLACIVGLTVSCQSNPDAKRVLVFHAASLSGVLSEIKNELRDISPPLDLVLEPSGSLMAARKISELGRNADLLLTADWRVIRDLLVPQQKADWVIQFLSNEIVLAHTEFSPYTQEIASDNWPSVLLRPDVRIGRASEQTAPIGYQTLQLWTLASKVSGLKGTSSELAEELDKKCKPQHITPDIAELVALLESHTIDYAFLFRSIAEEHHLKVTRLSDLYNLGNRSNAALYAKAVVPLQLHGKASVPGMKGSPIVYGLTVPSNAKNSNGAERVVEYILGSKARRLFSSSGYTPIVPAFAPIANKLPASLSKLVQEKK